MTDVVETTPGVTPAVLDRLLKRIDDRSLTCGVLGLGFIGGTVTEGLLEAGFTVRGSDISATALARLEGTLGTRFGERARFATTPELLNGCEVLFVAIRLRVSETGCLDPAGWEACLRALEARRGLQAVLVSSTVPPGTTRQLAQRLAAAGADGFPLVAHCPERLSVGHDWRDWRRMPHLVGGATEGAGVLAARLLSCTCAQVVRTPSAEVAELSKLLENAFLTTNVALVGEITRLAHALGVSAHAVTDAAMTKTTGFMPFHPGPGVGGHCLPNDLVLLEGAARSAGVDSSLLRAIGVVVAAQPTVTVEHLAHLMDPIRGGLDGSRVLVLGVGFKVGSSDLARSPALAVLDELVRRSAVVAFTDPLVAELDLATGVRRSETVPIAAGRFDGAIIAAGDPRVDLDDVTAAVPVVLDVGGARIMSGSGHGVHTL